MLCLKAQANFLTKWKPTMDAETAKSVFKKHDIEIQDDNSLNCVNRFYLNWYADANKDYINIDGEMTVEMLEAIAWWMKNKCLTK